MKAVIIHGSNGNPEKHWYPWIANRVESAGGTAIRPALPVGDDQLLANWLDVFEQYQEQLEGTVLVGHSLGVPFILNLLERWQPDIRAALLVAGFAGHIDVDDEPNLDDFADRSFDWPAIRRSCRAFHIFHADNDPYVPREQADLLGDRLHADPTIVEGAGHFTAGDGYTTFPALWKEMSSYL